MLSSIPIPAQTRWASTRVPARVPARAPPLAVMMALTFVFTGAMFNHDGRFVAAQSTGHDPYANVISNPYTSDHSRFRFGQPTAVEMYQAEGYHTKYRGDDFSSKYYEGRRAPDHTNTQHRGDHRPFSFERWGHRCEAPCHTLKHLERQTVQMPAASVVELQAKAQAQSLVTHETLFSNGAVKSGIMSTELDSIVCVDGHAPAVDIASVCECPHGKYENIISADGTVHGKFDMDVAILSERFGRKPLEPTAGVTVEYRVPVQLVVVQQCKARMCESPAARIPYVVWRDIDGGGEDHGTGHGDVSNPIFPEYHVHEDEIDVVVTVADSVCKKSFLRRREFVAIVKKHAVEHAYERLANIARAAYAQLLANEGLCVFKDVTDGRDGHDVETGAAIAVQQIMPARQLVHVHNGPTPFDMAVPIGWHRPLAVGGIEQVFRLDGFEPTVVFVDSARLRKLFVEKTEIDPARMFPIRGNFVVQGSVSLDLGISVLRKHSQFYGRSICTSDGSCIKIPWYGDQYYTQPFADIRDAVIRFHGVAHIHDDGYAFLSHLDGDMDRSTDTFEYRPDVEIGKHIWIREVVDKNRLADSLISEGVVMSILGGLREELQYEIDQYQFVPSEQRDQ